MEVHGSRTVEAWLGEFWALRVRWVQLWGSLSILWHCLSLGLEWKLTFSSPVATADFSKFAGILSAALSQHHHKGNACLIKWVWNYPFLFSFFWNNLIRIGINFSLVEFLCETSPGLPFVKSFLITDSISILITFCTFCSDYLFLCDSALEECI